MCERKNRYFFGCEERGGEERTGGIKVSCRGCEKLEYEVGFWGHGFILWAMEKLVSGWT